MRRIRRVVSSFIIFALIFCLAQTSTISYAKNKMKLNKKSLVLNADIYEEATIRLKNPTKKVKWKTSNKKVICINKTWGYKKQFCVITAYRKGKATITATVGKKKFKCKVTAKKRATNKSFTNYKDQTLTASQDNIVLTSKNISTIIDFKVKYACTLTYNNSNKNAVNCSWSNGQLHITGINDGTAKITITNNLNSASVIINVTVVYRDISFQKTPLYLSDTSQYSTKTYTVNKVYRENGYIYCDITKTYDSRGRNQSSSCAISWKLYKRGTKEVVDSGTSRSDSLLMDEINSKIALMYPYQINKLELGDYEFIILNTN